MKKVKFLVMALLVSLFFMTSSCGEKDVVFNSESGKFLIPTISEVDSIRYLNVDTTLTDESVIRNVIFETCLKGKFGAKNPLTIKPIKVFIYGENDTTIASYTFSASNSYGVPGELTSNCKFINGELIEGSCFVY